MKREQKKKLNESIEWFIQQIQTELKIPREKAIAHIEKYLEENW